MQGRQQERGVDPLLVGGLMGVSALFLLEWWEGGKPRPQSSPPPRPPQKGGRLRNRSSEREPLSPEEQGAEPSPALSAVSQEVRLGEVEKGPRPQPGGTWPPRPPKHEVMLLVVGALLMGALAADLASNFGPGDVSMGNRAAEGPRA